MLSEHDDKMTLNTLILLACFQNFLITPHKSKDFSLAEKIRCSEEDSQINKTYKHHLRLPKY